MRDVSVLWVSLIIVLIVLVVIAASKANTTTRELLRRTATAAGWSDLRNLFFAGTGVKGTWRSFPVELSYMPRQKGVPRRLILKVRARTDSRLIVKRKFSGLFSNRPLTWFGPPLVEVKSAEELWVRADEAGLAERLIADHVLASLIWTNLVARFDEIRVDGKGLRILRALDEQLVREKYGIPAFQMRMDPARIEPIAREELALADALVTKLSMMA
jgi:hypothetical protein